MRNRVLIVDDDKMLSDMLKQMLSRIGYFSVACNNPIAALRLFSGVPERFNAAIVDEIMPDLRGIELARQLIQVKDDIPIILMTGYGNMISFDEIRQSGVRATLIKPIIKEWLQESLARLLKKQVL